MRTRTEITKLFRFEAGHNLIDVDQSTAWNEAVFGKCFRPHGHSYIIEVTFSAPHNELEDQLFNGMVVNLDDVGRVMAPLLNDWDHRILNELGEFNNPALLTTAENVARVIFKYLSDALSRTLATLSKNDVRIEVVTVHETATGKATVRRVEVD